MRPVRGQGRNRHRAGSPTKEYLGGFWIIEAADLDEALAWARKGAVACAGDVEVRPFQDEPQPED